MSSESTQPDLTVRLIDLGRMDYTLALTKQQEIHAQVAAGQAPDTLLLVEHDPVITFGRRPDAQKHLLASPQLLARHGVALCPTNRGGDITYHGPGQLVAYPIIRLNPRSMNLRQYVWTLEQALIDSLSQFELHTGRDQCAVGVWTIHDTPPAKIAAIGVRATQWVTMHGLALNVTTNLDHFKLIVPCGLAGRPVTSMHQQLADRCPTFDKVKATVADILMTMLSRRHDGPAALEARS